jgi:hypothetical protein
MAGIFTGAAWKFISARPPGTIIERHHMTAQLQIKWLRRTEWIVTVLTAVAAVWLHFFYLIHAGGLWRDEISVKSIATLPSYGQVWEALPHDHCPILFPSLVRIWSASGLGTTDVGLRVLGLVCGLSLMAAFWIASRTMGRGLPLLSLALAGLNFTVIRYGDSIRAYGLGTAFILLTLSLVWRFIETPTLRHGLFAGIVALLGVQTLYQNAFFLLTICIAGTVVCFRRRQLYRALGVLGIGLPAALSLLPYLHPLHQAQSWWIVSKSGVDFLIFLFRIAEATGMLMGVWLVLVPIAALFGIGCALLRTSSAETRSNRDLLLFTSLSLAIGLAGFGLFVKLSGLLTQRWYYIPAMGFAVACCDIILPRIHRATRLGVLVIAVVVVSLAFPAALSSLQLSQTNGDQVAAQVSESARPGDLVIVHPWYYGITFEHYYGGVAPWTTLPPLEDYRFHRYDLLKSKLQMTNVIEPLLKQVEATLRSGHDIWIVGKLHPLPPDGQPPVDLPVAPNGPDGWGDRPYSDAWSARLRYFLDCHITNAVMLVDPATNRVSPLENMPLTIATGWRSAAPTNPP